MFTMLNYSSRKVTTRSILTSRNSVAVNESMKIIECDRQVKFNNYIAPRKLENKVSRKDHNSIVTIVAIGAKWLPTACDDGLPHKIFCKFSLGSESYKTKVVASAIKPEWGERFQFHLHHDETLKISVWDKAKQMNFMGSCILDLSLFESERTHEIWKELEDGYGMIHLSISICSSSESLSNQLFSVGDTSQRQRQNKFDFRNNWDLVGLLHVNIFGAKGLLGKPNAYCTLELDNERVQTPTQKTSSEPCWNRFYVFNVHDVTSTLDLKVYNSRLFNEPVGKVSIPLLMITNGEQSWYALKDINKSYSTKGNYPRVLLQMTLVWNPLKASLRLFRPKLMKHVKKPKKFDVALVYSNIEFIGKMFNFLYEINECIKRLFEWDDNESSLLALIGWLVFCVYFRPWTVPLWLLLPFVYHWLFYRNQKDKYKFLVSPNLSYLGGKNHNKVDKTLKGKLQNLQCTTLSVTNGIEYLANLSEKINNLISFKVPFLSYLAMMFLLIASLVFYFIPFNYLLMIFGIYKYTRKYLNPDRVLNNDLLDFLSRIPNDEQLRDWKELNVLKPVQPSGSARSISTGVLS